MPESAQGRLLVLKARPIGVWESGGPIVRWLSLFPGSRSLQDSNHKSIEAGWEWSFFGFHQSAALLYSNGDYRGFTLVPLEYHPLGFMRNIQIDLRLTRREEEDAAIVPGVGFDFGLGRFGIVTHVNADGRSQWGFRLTL